MLMLGKCGAAHVMSMELSEKSFYRRSVELSRIFELRMGKFPADQKVFREVYEANLPEECSLKSFSRCFQLFCATLEESSYRKTYISESSWHGPTSLMTYIVRVRIRTV